MKTNEAKKVELPAHLLAHLARWEAKQAAFSIADVTPEGFGPVVTAENPSFVAPEQVQKLKNSITEGEMLLKSEKSAAKRLTIQTAVWNTKDKLRSILILNPSYAETNW